MELPIGAVETTANDRATARRLWAHLEVLHTPVYFAPQVYEAQGELGLTDRAAAYTATRIAGAGPVGPAIAQAAFYGFAPAVVHRALPAAWKLAAPAEVLAATTAAVGRTLAALLADHADDVRRAAELAREAADLHPVEGRFLAASRADLPWPDDPHLVLWEAATRIREWRGDGHNALLVAAGLDGCACHLTLAGDGEIRRTLRGRGWSDAEWDAARARLQARGLLDADGALTDLGRDLRRRIEDATDELAVPPWTALGAPKAEQLLAALAGPARAVADAGFLPERVTRRLSG